MNFINEKGDMPIVGFYGPLKIEYESKKGWKAPDYLTDSYFEMIRDAGINLINYTQMDYAKEPAAVRKALLLAEKYQIGIYVADSGLRGNMSHEELRNRMSEYSHYHSFKGIHVVDEPGSPHFGPKDRLLSDFYEIMQKLGAFDDVVANVNLFALHPDWIGVDDNTVWLDRAHYEAYVEEYCKNCRPKMLSADYYIFDAYTVATSRDYFENLEILNHYAQKYQIPFWMYIQLGGQWNDSLKEKETLDYYPQPNEVIWNVNTSLACGAKGIAYFPLLQPYYFAFAPDGEMDFERNGLIKANGEKSQWYACTKKANEQIQAVGNVLMQMTLKQMVAKGYYAEQNLPRATDSYGSLKMMEPEDSSNQYGVLAGCFESGTQEAFYVVNNDVKVAQSVRLKFDNAYEMELLSSECHEIVCAKECRVSLEPGAGILIILKEKQYS